MRPVPVTLDGARVRLEPLDRRHAAGLLEAGRDREIWRYMPHTGFDGLASVEAWIDGALELVADGAAVVFAMIDKDGGAVAGSTRYLDIRPEHRAVEIGWTWLGIAHQRTAINTECKYLLLRHAFEDLGMIRVQLKTDLRNERSQRAIERIGGVREGVLRRSLIMPDGHRRDSVYYSIVEEEWPAVAQRLRSLLARDEADAGPSA